MSEYHLNQVEEFTSVDLQGSYLLLFGVDKVPPHIGWVSDTKYYSKSSQGGKQNYEVEKILASVKRKRIPTVLLKLKVDQLTPNAFFDDIPLSAGESCLNPIKELLSSLDAGIKHAPFVFDLIELLKAADRIEKVYHLNCEEMIQGKSLSLKKYGQVDIDKAIHEAKRPC